MKPRASIIADIAADPNPTPRAVIAGVEAGLRVHAALTKARGWGLYTPAEMGALAQAKAEAMREAGRGR